MADRQPRFVSQSTLDVPLRGMEVRWPYQHTDYAEVTHEQGAVRRTMAMWRHRERRDFFVPTHVVVNEAGIVTYQFFLGRDNFLLGRGGIQHVTELVDVKDPTTKEDIVDFRQVEGEPLSARFSPIRSGIYNREPSSFASRQDAIDAFGNALAHLLERPQATEQEYQRPTGLVATFSQISRDIASSTRDGREHLLGTSESMEEYLSRLVKESSAYKSGGIEFYTRAMRLIRASGVLQAVEQVKSQLTDTERIYSTIAEALHTLSIFNDRLDGVDGDHTQTAIFHENGIQFGDTTDLTQGFPHVLAHLTSFAQWGEPIPMAGGYQRVFDIVIDEETQRKTVTEQLMREGRVIRSVSFPFRFSVNEAADIAEDMEGNFSNIGKIDFIIIEDPRTEAVFSTVNLVATN